MTSGTKSTLKTATPHPVTKRGRGRPKLVTAPGQVSVTFRLPAEDVAAMDAMADRLKAERPGLQVNRTDVLRVLYLRGFAHEGIVPQPIAPASEKIGGAP